MWKRTGPKQAAVPSQKAGAPAPTPAKSLATGPAGAARSSSEPKYHLGRSVRVKGDITGSEDLNIDGRVEGKVHLKGHALTVGPNAQIHAEITAKRVKVKGGVEGSIQADEMLEIDSTGSVEVSDIRSSRISIAEGARFKGCLDIKGSEEVEKAEPQKARAAKTSVINLE